MNAVLSVLGRAMLCAIFVLSAVAQDIPHFNDVTGLMAKTGIPQPNLLLAGAIAFKVIGSIALLLGYKARFGALLLFLFLLPATYYFHNFWVHDPNSKEFTDQMIQFQKNLGLAGAMVFIMANGSGAGSLDRMIRRRQP